MIHSKTNFRKEIVSLIRNFCNFYQADFKLAWRHLYNEFKFLTGYDVYSLIDHTKVKKLDKIEKDGRMVGLYLVAQELFSLDNIID